MNAIRTYVLATGVWDHNLHFLAIAAYIIIETGQGDRLL